MPPPLRATILSFSDTREVTLQESMEEDDTTEEQKGIGFQVLLYCWTKWPSLPHQLAMNTFCLSCYKGSTHYISVYQIAYPPLDFLPPDFFFFGMTGWILLTSKGERLFIGRGWRARSMIIAKSLALFRSLISYLHPF